MFTTNLKTTGQYAASPRQEKNLSKQGQPQTGNLRNTADHITNIENMVAVDYSFGHTVIRNSKKTPCMICYTDDQIADLKIFCAPDQTPLGIDKDI